MMTFFVGDEPSKKNKNPEIPFVGTKSYKTLLSWIADLEVNITDVVLTNRENIKVHNSGAVEVELTTLYTTIEKGDTVIALGDKASKYLKKINIDHFKLPHPSGLNRKNNDKKWLSGELEKCRRYLNE